MQAEEKPWWSVFPAPQRTAPVYPKENLLRQFNILQDVLNAGTLLIDVRRTDYEGTQNKSCARRVSLMPP